MFGLSVKERVRRNLVGYWPLDEDGGVAKALYGRGPELDLSEVSGTMERIDGPGGNIPYGRRFVTADTEQLISTNPITYQDVRVGIQPFAVCFWARVNAFPATAAFLISLEAAGATRNWNIYTSSTGNVIRMSLRNAAGSLLDVGTGMTPGSGWVMGFYGWRGPNCPSEGRLFVPGAAGVSELFVKSSGSLTDVSVTAGPLELGNVSTINNGSSADLARLFYWVGRFPTREEQLWLFNNGKGQPRDPWGGKQ